MRNILTFVVLLSSLSSCKDDAADKLSTRTELLIKDKWILQASTIDPAVVLLGNSITDVYALVPACDRDNFAQYNSNKTGVYDEGATKCEAQDPQTVAFTWSFESDETQLRQDGDLYQILELSESTLKVRFSVDGAEYGMVGKTFTLTNTYRH
ncbi:MAG: hypothetical protein H6606_09605 [Flavobacteriales bacterium]|nr:hypothetical protein [Flavobacteriales bacterium]